MDKLEDRGSVKLDLAPGVHGGQLRLETCSSFQHSNVFSAYREPGASCVTLRPQLSGQDQIGASGMARNRGSIA